MKKRCRDIDLVIGCSYKFIFNGVSTYENSYVFKGISQNRIVFNVDDECEDDFAYNDSINSQRYWELQSTPFKFGR